MFRVSLFANMKFDRLVATKLGNMINTLHVSRLIKIMNFSEICPCSPHCSHLALLTMVELTM